MPAAEAPELSVVMPCLDEAETLGRCIEKAQRGLEALGVSYEILVADNGSRDGSPAIACRQGAQVVHVEDRGYGSALRGGIEAARGRYVIMGDADDSYDFGNLEPFLARLRAGDDLVMGNRFAGGIEPGAMPRLHRWLGNPVLSALGRWLFRSRVRDFHCGLRGLRKDAYEKLGLRTTGMEFASEMVVRAELLGLRVSEVPTRLSPAGRSRAPHLRSWRDGWRHLRFMLLFSPRWLFLAPGLLLLGTGGLASVWLLGDARRLGPVYLDIHTLLMAGLACLLGYQLIVFAAFTRVFAILEGFTPMPAYVERLFRWVNLEIGLLVGLGMTLLGLGMLVAAVWSWGSADFGVLDARVTMRQVIPGAVLLVLGMQTVFSSFFLSILGLRRK